MSEPQSGYVIRIGQGQMERQLFSRREYFVGIKRDWAPGLRIIFVKKIENNNGQSDWFTGSGAIERFVGINNLTNGEVQKCVQNNWYGKIIFGMLIKIFPSVAVRDAFAGKKLSEPAQQERIQLQTGVQIAVSEIERIENMANIRIYL